MRDAGVALACFNLSPDVLLSSDHHTADVYREVLRVALRERDEMDRARVKALATHIGTAVAKALAGKR